MLQYNFPGNIRELKSVIELACVLADDNDIEYEHIQTENNQTAYNSLNEELSLHQFNIQLIQHYLQKYNYDVLKVAKQLDIGKSTIYRMIKSNEIKLQRNAYEN